MGHRIEVGQRGFTLLELIVTLMIVALAVGLSAPALGRGLQGLRARAEVAGFSAVFRHARDQAIATQRTHAVVVDPAAHRVVILAGDQEVRGSRNLPPHLTVEAHPAPALTVRFEPQGVSSGGLFLVTSGESRYRVTVDSLTGRVKTMRE